MTFFQIGTEAKVSSSEGFWNHGNWVMTVCFMIQFHSFPSIDQAQRNLQQWMGVVFYKRSIDVPIVVGVRGLFVISFDLHIIQLGLTTNLYVCIFHHATLPNTIYQCLDDIIDIAIRLFDSELLKLKVDSYWVQNFLWSVKTHVRLCIRKRVNVVCCESLVKTYKATMRFKVCLCCFPLSVRIFLFVGISQFSNTYTTY